MRRRAGTTATLCALALTLVGAGSYSEADLKAALVLRIATYVEWPSEAFSSSAVCIGVLGEGVFSREAHQALEARSLHGRPVYVRSSIDPSDLTGCPVVFVSDDGPPPELRSHSILTIGDAPGFARRGGAVELVKERGRIGFVVNRASAKQSGLRVSSQLLRLASRVYDGSAGETVPEVAAAH